VTPNVLARSARTSWAPVVDGIFFTPFIHRRWSAHLAGSRGGQDLIHTVHSQEVECVTPNVCSARTSWAPVVDGISFTPFIHRRCSAYFVGSRGGQDLIHTVHAQEVECVTPNVCSARTSWAPVVDGIMLPAPPDELLKQVIFYV